MFQKMDLAKTKGSRREKIKRSKPSMFKLKKGTIFEIEGTWFEVVARKTRNRYVVKSINRNK